MTTRYARRHRSDPEHQDREVLDALRRMYRQEKNQQRRDDRAQSSGEVGRSGRRVVAGRGGHESICRHSGQVLHVWRTPWGD